MEVRLRVDWIRCDGFGLCGDLAPDLVELDEWRYPILLSGALDPWQLDAAQRAADCCPMKALIIEPVPAERTSARRVAVPPIRAG